MKVTLCIDVDFHTHLSVFSIIIGMPSKWIHLFNDVYASWMKEPSSPLALSEEFKVPVSCCHSVKKIMKVSSYANVLSELQTLPFSIFYTGRMSFYRLSLIDSYRSMFGFYSSLVLYEIVFPVEEISRKICRKFLFLMVRINMLSAAAAENDIGIRFYLWIAFVGNVCSLLSIIVHSLLMK